MPVDKFGRMSDAQTRDTGVSLIILIIIILVAMVVLLFFRHER